MATRQPHKLVFVMAGTLHLLSGIGLLIWPQISRVTSISNLVTNFEQPVWAGWFLSFVGLSAILSLCWESHTVAFGLLGFQQYVLLSSIGAVWHSVGAGQYPDGTRVSSVHLAFDQMIYVLLAICHSYAIWDAHCWPILSKLPYLSRWTK